MELDNRQVRSLETPCLVIDVAQVRRNIAAMQSEADAAGCRLRPHIKTHKMPLFARMQVEAGADGVCCAKVSEAEVMAAGGIDDIFIAYPLVGEFRIRRAAALQKDLRRLIVAADSLSGARMLDAAAEELGVSFEVRLEIDTGAGRTGVPIEGAAALAYEISRMKNLHLTGIYTFKSLVLAGLPTEDNAAAALEEGVMMAKADALIRAAGIELADISAGSSPTGVLVAKTGMVNEIRPGTYIFKDVMLTRERVAEPCELAVRYFATVVSCEHPEYAVLDGGTKCFPSDVQPGLPPYFYPGFAVVEGDENLCLTRMNEEHGILTAKNGETGLHVGQVIALLPVHVCTAINMQNTVYLYEDGVLRKQAVQARGMLV